MIGIQNGLSIILFATAALGLFIPPLYILVVYIPLAAILTLSAIKRPLNKHLVMLLFVAFLALGTLQAFICTSSLIPILSFISSALVFILPSETPEIRSRKKRREVSYSHEKLRRVNPYNQTPEEFEKTISSLLTSMGVENLETLEISETGVDMGGILEGKKYVILARRYRGAISVKLLRRLFERMLEEDAERGMFITTSDFSQNAYRFVEGKPVDLITGEKLLELAKAHLKVILEL